MIKIKNIIDPEKLAYLMYKSHIKSVKEIAEKIGVDRSYISKCVSGQIGISNKRLYQMAELLNCKPEDLLSAPRISHS